MNAWILIVSADPPPIVSGAGANQGGEHEHDGFKVQTSPGPHS